MTLKLEICAGSLNSALAAWEGGADRIELCDNLSEGGTTPSYGTIKVCRSEINLPIFPIIRPRGGNFVYSDHEFEVMKQDVVTCKELDCEGIVFGILKPDGRIDVSRSAELVDLAGNMQLTFHRAFDRCTNPESSLEEIIGLGFHRVLTSGGATYAEDGLSLLKRLVEQSAGRTSIMPGSGITSGNILKIAAGSGAMEFHSTAKKQVSSDQEFISIDALDRESVFETDAVKVRKLKELLDSIS